MNQGKYIFSQIVTFLPILYLIGFLKLKKKPYDQYR